MAESIGKEGKVLVEKFVGFFVSIKEFLLFDAKFLKYSTDSSLLGFGKRIFSRCILVEMAPTTV